MAAGLAGTDLIEAEHAVATAVAAADVVVPVGAGTHREVGGPIPIGTEVRAPAGVVAYDPADLTITLGAGTTVAELVGTLGAAGQECALDPRDPAATVGGVLSTGLSGCADFGTGRCVTASSRCASRPLTVGSCAAAGRP